MRADLCGTGAIGHLTPSSAVESLETVTPHIATERQHAFSGWTTISMFNRYAITSDSDQREALRRVEQHLQAQGAVSNVVALPKRSK